MLLTRASLTVSLQQQQQQLQYIYIFLVGKARFFGVLRGRIALHIYGLMCVNDFLYARAFDAFCRALLCFGVICS